jgi:hypothetical protein
MISWFPAAIVTRGRNQRHLPIWVKMGSAFAGTSAKNERSKSAVSPPARQPAGEMLSR